MVVWSVTSSSVALGSALPVRMLLREQQRHHQRADLAMSWPMRPDLKGPAQHREHDLHVVDIAKVVHADGWSAAA